MDLIITYLRLVQFRDIECMLGAAQGFIWYSCAPYNKSYDIKSVRTRDFSSVVQVSIRIVQI